MTTLRVTCVAAIGLVSLVPGQGTWVQRAPATLPGGRVLAGMAYDSTRARVLAFGSSSGSGVRETWSWDGTDWSLLTSAASLDFGRMAYDSARDRMVAVEGLAHARFDGVAWTASAPIPGLPGGAWVSALTFDSARSRVVAFVDGYLQSIAEWNGTAWSLPTLTAQPPPFRYRTSLVFDPIRNVSVMFGGRQGNTYLADTWEWDGTNWQMRSPATSPPARWYTQMTWHAGLRRVILFGGEDASTAMNDMWAWDGTNWQPILPANSPPQRAMHSMAYDPSRDRIVLAFGQRPGLTYPDTWEYVMGGQSPRDVELFDADGDGDLDVATANQGSHNVGLRTNNGAGALDAEVTVPLTAADHAPVALSRCDLDDDGSRDDLAVVSADSSTVVLLTNPASASPTVVSLGVAGLRPSCVAAGDLDANPIDDLVVGREGEPVAGGSGLAVVLNGGVAVDLAIPAPHPTRVVKVTLGDLDGDGDLDLAAVAQGSSDELLMFAGDGAGALTFAGALTLPTSGTASGLCCRDFDGDGTNDLAVVLPQLFPPSQSLRVYRRTGTGALSPGLFTAPLDIATAGTFAVDLACGDLADGSIDGFVTRVDLAQANAGSGTVTLRHEFTGSGFSASSSPTVGTNPVAVAVGDLNGDGCDDVVVANLGSDDVTVVLSTPAALAQTYGTGCGGPTISAVGLPTMGNPAFGVRVNNGRASAPALLLISVAPADVVLPPVCRLLLANPLSQILLFTSATGQATLSLSVPALNSFRGVDLFFQGAVFRSPGGAFADTLDLSDALRVQAGQ